VACLYSKPSLILLQFFWKMTFQRETHPPLGIYFLMVLKDFHDGPEYSRKYSRKYRNDTIDPYPPRIVKILCITRREFKRLKLLVGVRRKKRSRGLAPWLKNKKKVSPRRVTEKKQKPTYEPTNISQAYESQTWRWIRVKQWFNEYKDDYTMS